MSNTTKRRSKRAAVVAWVGGSGQVKPWTPLDPYRASRAAAATPYLVAIAAITTCIGALATTE